MSGTTVPVDHPTRRRRPFPAPVAPEQGFQLTRALTYLVMLGTLAGFAWAYRQGYYKALPFPRNTFLFLPGDHFHDMYNLYGVVQSHALYSQPIANYPPFAYVLVEPFRWAGYTGATVLWTAIAAVGIGGFLWRQLDYLPRIDLIAAVLALTFATYPFLISYDRGNLELFVTVLLAGYAYALQTNRMTTAAALVGAMAAIKGYPIVFGAVFLVRMDWRSIGVCVGVAVVLTFLGSGYYDFNLPHTLDLLQGNLGTYNDTYVIGDAGLGWGCSLFGPIKLLAVDWLGGDIETIRTILPIYEAITVVMLLGLVYALWRLPLLLWEQVALLTIAFNVLPTVSGGYKLLHLIVPIGMFLREGGDSPRRWWYAGAFVLLLIPKAYVLLRDNGVNIAVVLDPLLMLFVAGLILAGAAGRRRAAGTAPGVADGAADYSPA
jgi:hypothetical protein